MVVNVFIFADIFESLIYLLVREVCIVLSHNGKGFLFIEDHKIFNFRFVSFIYFCQFCFVYAEAIL